MEDRRLFLRETAQTWTWTLLKKTDHSLGAPSVITAFISMLSTPVGFVRSSGRILGNLLPS